MRSMEGVTTADKEGTTEESREGLMRSMEGVTTGDKEGTTEESREGLMRSVEGSVEKRGGETVLLGWQCGIEGRKTAKRHSKLRRSQGWWQYGKGRE